MTRVTMLSVLFICACAYTAASPPIVSNEAEDPLPRVATLKDNLAATVSVYCFWRNPAVNDTTWDIEVGVVVDEIHVLAILCDAENSLMYGSLDEYYLESITIGPPDNMNETGYGPWEARQVSKGSEGSNFGILATDVPIPLPSVIPSAKTPELGDLLYTITLSYADDEALSFTELLVVAPRNDHEPWSVKKDFAVLFPFASFSPMPAGIFNQLDEFVGFVVEGISYLTIPKKAPAKFQNGKPWGYGYDIAAVSKTLKLLMRQAGIAGFNYQP